MVCRLKPATTNCYTLTHTHTHIRIHRERKHIQPTIKESNLLFLTKIAIEVHLAFFTGVLDYFKLKDPRYNSDI